MLREVGHEDTYENNAMAEIILVQVGQERSRVGDTTYMLKPKLA